MGMAWRRTLLNLNQERLKSDLTDKSIPTTVHSLKSESNNTERSLESPNLNIGIEYRNGSSASGLMLFTFLQMSLILN